MGKLSFAQRLYPFISLIFLWPALFNGTPFFFPDTSAYIREADAAVHYVTGHSSEWSTVIRKEKSPGASQSALRIEEQNATSGPAASSQYQSSFFKNVLLGRSIYYGFIAYLGVLGHSFWIPVTLQALVAGIAIVGALRHVVDPVAEPRRFRALVLNSNLVACFTPLPYYVSILMPDVFAGLLILAVAVVALGWQREAAGWRLFWFALLAVGALVHSTNILMLLALGVLSVLFAWMLKLPRRWTALSATILAALVGFAGEIAFGQAISHAMGRPPLRPPFVSVRLIADGPGTAYLRETCPESGFAYCDFQPQLSAWSDTMLWSQDPRDGIFSISPADVQVRISKEEPRFLWQVLTHHPLWTLETVTQNAAKQLSIGGLMEFNGPRGEAGMVEAKLPRATIDAILASRQEHSEMPVDLYKAYAIPLIALSLLLLSAVFFIPSLRKWRLPVALILSGVLINGIICGAMSGPHQRYQDRVMWLPVVLAAILLFAKARTVTLPPNAIRAQN